MSNIIDFTNYKALKEISEHYDLDFDALRKENVIAVTLPSDGDTEIEDQVEENI